MGSRGAVAAIFAAAVFGILALVTIPGGRDARGTTGVQVFVNNNAFCGAAGAPCPQPLTTQIDPGQTVTWIDGQAASTHSVTHCLNSNWTGCRGSQGILFDSTNLSDPPVLYTSFTFTDPGTYFYRCEIHTATMRGIVQVGPPSVPPTPSPTAAPTPTTPPTASPSPSPSPAPTLTSSPSPTATPDTRPGDVNCDGRLDEADAFEVLEYLAVGDAGTGAGCSDIGSSGSGRVKGDADCDGQVTAADALLILIARSGATLPPLPLGCPGP